MKAAVLALTLLMPVSMVDFAVPVAVKPSGAKHTDNECLASVIYHEANGEPLEGQKAVYEVVMSRARAFRMSICAVVKAPKQFSWYGEGKPIFPFTARMQDLLKRVKNHPPVLESKKFRWFYSGEKTPQWATDMDCRAIGNHNFCKEKDKQEDGSFGQVWNQGESPVAVTE